MKYLLSLLIVVVSGSVECPHYIATPNLAKDVCMSNVTTPALGTYELYIRSCNNVTFCSTEGDTYPKNCTTIMRYPGEICGEADECRYSVCVNGICYGFEEKERCRWDYDCAPGFFCNNDQDDSFSPYGICVKTRKLNELCNATSKCDSNLLCQKGRCIQMGSLSNGEPSTNPLACSSLYISEGKCDRGLKLIRSDGKEGPIDCTETCNYTNSKGETTHKTCECGYTEKGNKYCPVLEGDANLADFWNYTRHLNTSENHIGCAPFCLIKPFKDMGEGYYKAIITRYKLNQWHNLMNNSEEIKKTFFADYWNAEEALKPKPDPPKPDPKKEEESSKTTLIIIIIVAVLGTIGLGVLAFFLIRKYRNKSEESLMTTS